MPWVGFSGVVDPVRFAVLISENDLGSAEVKLLDFHRYLLSCVSLLHCFIVIGLRGDKGRNHDRVSNILVGKNRDANLRQLQRIILTLL